MRLNFQGNAAEPSTSVFLPTKLFVALVAMSLLFATGCLPKEVATTETASGDGEQTYSGLVSALTVGSTKVKLTWAESKLDTTVAYNIYDVSVLWKPALIKTVPAGSTSTTLTGLTPQKLYVFRVRAADKKNNEDINTNDLKAIPYAGVTDHAVESSSSATIKFNDASDADSVVVFCHTLLDPIDSQVAETEDVTKTSILITNLEPGVQYTCRVALKVSGFIDNNTATTVFTPIGTAASLVFTTQPGSATAGNPLLAQPVIKIVDANGTVVAAGPDAEAQITLTISTASTDPGGSVRGTTSIKASRGVATFTGLNVREAGTKKITATKADTSSVARGSPVITQDSADFIISPDVVSPIYSSITTDYDGVSPKVADGNASYNVTITLKDQYGNPVRGTTPQFSSTNGADTLIQPTAQTDASGVSSGSINTTSADLTRILKISSPTGLDSDTTPAPFTHGPATKVAFFQQPTNAGVGVPMGTVKVAIQDQFSNVVTTGASSTALVNLVINNNPNGATLSGTKPVAAVAGVAEFTDLSIDKNYNGYQLQATSGTLNTALSSSFNIGSAPPFKVQVTGVTSTKSGVCSGTAGAAGKFTIKLLDSGGNLATVSSTRIKVTGLGSGFLSTSSSCASATISDNGTYDFIGTATKDFYFKDLKAEGLTITVVDAAGALVPAVVNLTNTASQMTMTPVASTVLAGKCLGIDITTYGAESTPSAGPLFADTPVSLTGLSANSTIWGDSGCTTTPLTPAAITLPATVGANYTKRIYLKDLKAESLSLSIADGGGNLNPLSGAQTVNVTASRVNFTGPTSVIAGRCSTAFTVSLKDELGNGVPSPAQALTLMGVSTSSGAFYTDSNCSTTALTTGITVAASVSTPSTLTLYFKDNIAEYITVYVKDPANLLQQSSSITIGVSPSKFILSANDSSTSTPTTKCVPFTLKSVDGANNNTQPITTIQAVFSGLGASGGFYTDSACTVAVASPLAFGAGASPMALYFKDQYPETLTLTVSDQAGNLTAATYDYNVTAAPAFIGTRGSTQDTNGFLWFKKGINFVSARQNALAAATFIHVSNDRNYMYVADGLTHRIHKFDYVNQDYIGWIGRNFPGQTANFLTPNSFVTGASPRLTFPTSADCTGAINNANFGFSGPLPGWCLGGQTDNSIPGGWSSNNTTGMFRDPRAIADDGNYIYVVNRSGFAIQRFNAESGAFAGWIGQIQSKPTASGPGTSNNCASLNSGITPGWCMGGANHHAGTIGSNPNIGDGNMYYPRQMIHYNGKLLVGVQGAVLKFNASTGAFEGWIGYVGGTAPTSAGTGLSNTCATTTNAVTPGWCKGGVYQTNLTPTTNPGAIRDPAGLVVISVGGVPTLFVMENLSSGYITKFNADSGALITTTGGSILNGFSQVGGWANGLTSDGSSLFINDYNRVIRTDLNGNITGWIGKVASSPGSSGAGNPLSCTLAINALTPGWCNGGSAKFGTEEEAFAQSTAIEWDGSSPNTGNLLVGGGTNSGNDTLPSIKSFATSSGAYQGSLAAQAVSTTQWSDDRFSVAAYYGFDDNSMYSPMGSYTDANYIYLTEYNAGRVKKIDKKTGAVIGWIGGITTKPTGGDSGCTTASVQQLSPVGA